MTCLDCISSISAFLLIAKCNCSYMTETLSAEEINVQISHKKIGLENSIMRYEENLNELSGF